MTDTRPVDVAVGVVVRGDGRVLLAQRPPGKPYAGWWEFPGGKLEAQESVEHALARELDEELGLRIGSCVPWVIRCFTYPHARVRLHFRRVFAFDGEPHGREGQAFAWCAPDAVHVAPLLPATVPVIAWLRLPGRVAFSAAAALGEDAFVAALDARLADGLGLLVLAEPTLSPARFAALYYRVRACCRTHGARLLVDAGHPPSFAQAADGGFVGSAAFAGLSARPPWPVAAAGVADGEGLRRAAALGFDWAVLDPAADPALLAHAGLPVYARNARLDTGAALHAGAHGVACGPRFWEE